MASLPAGVPFPQWVRERVLELSAQGLKSPAIADALAPLGPKERAVRDIIAAERDEQRRTAKPHTNGHAPMLLPHEARDLYLYQSGDVAATNKQKAAFIEATTGKVVSSSLVSKEIVHRLNFTYKKINNHSNKRVESDRVDWFANGPWPAVGRAGCRGVPTEAMVDLDEKTVKYGDLLRQMGHAQRGDRCTRAAPPPRSEKAYNLILAIDVNVGVLCYVMFRGSVNKDVFYLFLALYVLPAIANTGPRFIMCDNLSSHFGDEIRDLVSTHGHIMRPRAIHSPDHGPVEWCFSHATTFSHEHDAYLIEHPKEFGRVYAAGLDTLTAAYVRRYFAAAHYLVAGEPYKPYMGQVS
mmetsp:Transcript_40424/g.92804  ORF Transcript_40424/g.92804 Transcript_40424/m.92804 type:complete len:352 (+) Transcript_40424:147-1202(+)|eukprot:CAMPEP_0182557312 /NCGR_PEP_ID=MMETSP1324-20130603/1258_1 /TAXON_ID=236786 /ORGANISM="Florenciella sp., Strain RCC1587" /LENGTH=351 /DNA_ID=CAMNT_0024769337 /DNA_START=133 /DNA_END=1188 /DNA_ORIENTATION=+